MTPADLAAIEARANAATAPPWSCKRYEGMDDDTLVRPEMTFADWRFCAAARTDIPALIAALREAWTWQSMENAPMDERNVLLALSYGVVIGSYSQLQTVWLDVGGFTIYPTHWKPLPQLPKESP